ncbi:EAL domain-containing protein [Marinobacter sp. F4206]|uniref:EAL domain-containing protein n=1 Tax=Marinobacter sp. F4206 TaxID=2861777 RepID=UPI001C5CD773|nr:EAL domain-containing protein [Marinobacter sp. F4206]MBW4934958.1 EAL domain-containing protein [Marinobacter sp. F4206]
MENDSADSLRTGSGEWLLGGGEMGDLVRSMDWSGTPLGPRQDWPQNLRSVINLCLNTSFPVNVAWGPRFVQIYNDSYRAFCGFKHPASMGQDIREMWASIWPQVEEAFATAVSGTPSPVANRRVFLDRAGYLEEAFFASSFSPIFDENGKVVGIFHPVTELTQQVLGERRLRVIQSVTDLFFGANTLESAITKTINALKRHKLEVPFALFYLIDPSGREAYLRAASGLDSAGSDVLVPAINLRDNHSIWPIDEALVASGNTELADLPERVRIVCSPYEEPVQEALLMPVTVAEGAVPNGVLIVGVSARRRLDTAYRNFFAMLRYTVEKELSHALSYERVRLQSEALEEQDRLKTTFFTHISHELRTPLTLLLGPVSETLKARGRSLSKSDRRRLEIAHRNALRLMKLVNSLLDFAQIEAGRPQLSFAPVDLPKATREVASMFESAFQMAGVELEIDCPDAPEPAYVDIGMWEKIVLNLLSNAFKFTLRGRVTLRLTWQADQIELIVEDTGIGIAESELPKVFDRFHRAPKGASRTYEGSGIGLALVRELVKLHSGTITAESVPDQGTRFTVRVPRGKAHLPEDQVTGALPHDVSMAGHAYIAEAMQWLGIDATPASKPGGHSREDTSARVLVVDDTADMRRYLYDILSPYCRVQTVADGQQALEAIRQDPPDLVISDLMLPNVDGFELVKTIRSSEAFNRLPVILLSARADEEARVEGLHSGADDYLVKPFSVAELLARVQLHLSTGRSWRRAVEKARHDDLTDLPNRTLIYEFTERLIASAGRAHSHMAVLFIDMDRFKPINDQHGHAVGDAVLIEVACRLREGVRDEDSVGRLGGDEFLAALSHLHAPSDAATVARHLVKVLSRPYQVHGLVLHTTPSIGVALYPEDGTTPDELTRAADQAMYLAKLSGNGQVRYYEREANQREEQTSLIEKRFKRALTQGEFELHYQPVVDLLHGQLTGVEAFIRWPGTSFGPKDFLPVAESCGLMEKLGDWIINEACHQLRVWGDEGMPPITLSINVSPMQCRQAQLVRRLMRSAAENGLTPGSIQIEITASEIFKGDDTNILQLLRKLKSVGFKLALDHFGSEESSLNHLVELAPDTLKMDQKFSQSNGRDAEQLAVVNGIVSLGSALGFQVVAEGIENAGILTTLQSAGCRDFQGFHICPPLAANDFTHWYHDWQAG